MSLSGCQINLIDVNFHLQKSLEIFDKNSADKIPEIKALNLRPFFFFFIGDLLRAERQTQGSEHGEVIEHHIVNGTIVPVKITCSLLERAMKESEKNDFLIDGFPRNEDNLTGWTEAMGDKVNLKFVLNIDCGESTCIER